MARNYNIIDFNLEKPLHLTNDQWVALLNVIRRKFCETPELSRHGLSAYLIAEPDTTGSQINIGLDIPKSKYFSHFDNDSIVSVFENWLSSHPLDALLSEAPSVGVPTFEILLQQRTFPQDPRDL